MSYDDAGGALWDHFRGEWDLAHPTVPRYGENQTPPPSIAEAWAAFDVVDGAGPQINVAPAEWRRVGEVAVSLYVPVNTGSALLRQMVDTVSTIFQGKAIVTPGGLTVRLKGTRLADVATTPAWTGKLVSHEFHYDVTS